MNYLSDIKNLDLFNDTLLHKCVLRNFEFDGLVCCNKMCKIIAECENDILNERNSLPENLKELYDKILRDNQIEVILEGNKCIGFKDLSELDDLLDRYHRTTSANIQLIDLGFIWLNKVLLYNSDETGNIRYNRLIDILEDYKDDILNERNSLPENLKLIYDYILLDNHIRVILEKDKCVGFKDIRKPINPSKFVTAD